MDTDKIAMLDKYSEMTPQERGFLLEAIKTYKPQKILEIGIAAGANSAMILDFLSNENLLDSTKLYAIDYNEDYYRDLYSATPPPYRKSGFLVDSLTPHLRSYYNLHTGGFSSNHLDNIGGDINLVIIDTVHQAPGEALDFLMVYPYLAKNAVVVFHDISYHTMCGELTHNICALMFFALSGKKSIPKAYPPYKNHFQNIGLCVLDDANANLALSHIYFRVLNMPWCYMPDSRDLDDFKSHIKRHYKDEFLIFFDDILPLQQRHLDKLYRAKPLSIRIKRAIKQFLKQILPQCAIDSLRTFKKKLAY